MYNYIEIDNIYVNILNISIFRNVEFSVINQMKINQNTTQFLANQVLRTITTDQMLEHDRLHRETQKTRLRKIPNPLNISEMLWL